MPSKQSPLTRASLTVNLIWFKDLNLDFHLMIQHLVLYVENIGTLSLSVLSSIHNKTNHRKAAPWRTTSQVSFPT